MVPSVKAMGWIDRLPGYPHDGYVAGEAETISYALDRLRSARCREIVNNKDLFWLAFCAVQLDSKSSDQFTVSKYDGRLQVSGNSEVIESVQAQVEILRNFFVKSFDREIIFICVPLSDLIHFAEYGADPINVQDLLPGIERSLFDAVIGPRLYGLSRMTGIVLVSIHLTVSFTSYECGFKRDPLAYQCSVRMFPPFPPKILLARLELFPKSAQMLQQESTPFDLEVVASDSTVSVYGQFVRGYGGKIIDKVKDGKLELRQYSTQTIRAFIRYVYQGWIGLRAEFVAQHKISIDELMDLAHENEIPQLFDHCVNLQLLLAEPVDAERIGALAQKYNDEYLAALHRHLLYEMKKR